VLIIVQHGFPRTNHHVLIHLVSLRGKSIERMPDASPLQGTGVYMNVYIALSIHVIDK